MSYHGAPAFVQTMNAQPQPVQYSQYVKLQQADGTWAVAPVAGSAQQAIYMQVPGPNGTMVLQQVVPNGPQMPKRTLSLNGKMEPHGKNQAPEEDHPWSVNPLDKDDLDDEGDLIYTSSSKSDCYFWTRWLWCACMEPMHIVTTKYVESSKFLGCSKESDSKAMDIFDDADLSQTCFQHIWNTCGCCCVDHGTITLLGADRSEWRLEKIHNANEVFDKVQKILAKNRKERRDKRTGKSGPSDKKPAGGGDKKKS